MYYCIYLLSVPFIEVKRKEANKWRWRTMSVEVRQQMLANRAWTYVEQA